jgi:hypothetical protein
MRYFLYNSFNRSRQIRLKISDHQKTEKCHTGGGEGGRERGKKVSRII